MTIILHFPLSPIFPNFLLLFSYRSSSYRSIVLYYSRKHEIINIHINLRKFLDVEPFLRIGEIVIVSEVCYDTVNERRCKVIFIQYRNQIIKFPDRVLFLQKLHYSQEGISEFLVFTEYFVETEQQARFSHRYFADKILQLEVIHEKIILLTYFFQILVFQCAKFNQ